eukprot:jgi/Mesvir1/1490/Mv14473-RA.1
MRSSPRAKKMAAFVEMEAAHSGNETSEGHDDEDGGTSMADFIDDASVDEEPPHPMDEAASQSAAAIDEAGPSRAREDSEAPSRSRAESPGPVPEGLAPEFRKRMGDCNDRVDFLFELPTKTDNEIIALLDMVNTHLVECSYTDLIADLFGMASRGPGDIEAALLTNSWTRLVTGIPLELHASIVACNTSAMSRLHGLLGQVEERMFVNYRDMLNHAISRVFCLREVLCTLLESRMDTKQLSCIPSSVIRLSSGNLDVNDFQRLLILITNVWTFEGLRRGQEGDESVYKQNVDSAGNNTHYWKKVSTILQWVSDTTSIGTSAAAWRLVTKNGGLKKAVVDYIKEASAKEFPLIPRDRHLFSFRNGVLSTEQDRFFGWAEEELTEEMGSCRYFDDIDVDEDLFEEGRYKGDFMTGEWFDIETEAVDKILNDQGYTEAIKRPFWALALGRMLYALKEMDRFEVMVFLKGIGGSGKSTLVRIIELIFKEDAGVISNNIEALFGLSQHKDKYAIYSYELNEKFNLSQADWLSLVSGEKMSLAQKHKDAVTRPWTSPFLAAGNKMFCTGDNANQILRRLLIFPFDNKPVGGQDTLLERRIERNIANIIIKANRAYRSFVEYVGARCVHDCLPEWFSQQRRKAQEASNPLITFLLHVSWVETGPEKYCPWEEFQRRFNEWNRQRDPRSRVVFEEDFYKHIFTDFGIRVVFERVRKRYPADSGPTVRSFYVYGVDFDSNRVEFPGMTHNG